MAKFPIRMEVGIQSPISSALFLLLKIVAEATPRSFRFQKAKLEKSFFKVFMFSLLAVVL